MLTSDSGQHRIKGYDVNRVCCWSIHTSDDSSHSMS